MVPSSFYYELLQECCPVKTSQNTVAVWYFSKKKKAQLPAIRITEQPILLTKRKINCLCYKCSKYFRSKRAVKSRSRSGPRPGI